MSAPWMKFYPSDWRADPALRMCSIGARGLWMEMLCIMHEADPYGSLRINGKPVSDRQMAGLAGASPAEVDPWLVELEEAGVFSRDDDGAIVSRRMMRDKAKAEADKDNGRRGGNPKLTKGVNPGVGDGDKAQKPEARDQITPTEGSIDDPPSGVRPAIERKPKAPSRKSQLPADWWPSDENRAYALKAGIPADLIDREAENFKNRCARDAPVYADFNAAWRTWCSNAIKFGLATGPPPLRLVNAPLLDANGNEIHDEPRGRRSDGKGRFTDTFDATLLALERACGR